MKKYDMRKLGLPPRRPNYERKYKMPTFLCRKDRAKYERIRQRCIKYGMTYPELKKAGVVAV